MTKLARSLFTLLPVITAIALALFLVALGLSLAGYPAAYVLSAWAHGAIGTWFDISVSLKNACPLILTGLAAGMAFRAGVLNIGGEGQSILGAIGAVVIATRLAPNLHPTALAIPTALLAAMLFGALWALISALLYRYRGVPVVLSTILLNFVALKLLSLLLEGPLRTHETQVIQSDTLPHNFWMPLFIDFFPNLAHVGLRSHIGILIALAVALLVWIMQSRTTFGFELLVTGLNPTAAKLAGMSVSSRQLAIFALSGAAAGLAGAIQVLGIEGHYLSPTPVAYGYAGIAVALLGRLHPLGILLAALFFAFLDQGAANVEISRYALPHELADIVKGLMVLLMLCASAYVARLKMRSNAGGTAK